MNRLTYFVLISLLLLASTIQAQDPREAQIRQLEEQERVAVMKGDSGALFGRLWADEMVVHVPANRVGTVATTKALLRQGMLQYARFERTIEKITFNNDLAIVMGAEQLLPAGKQTHADQQVTRRFTNIWRQQKNGWQIIARQATIIRLEPTDVYKKRVLHQIDSLIQYQERLILTQDTVAMRAFYPNDMVITNPFGQMIGKEKVIERVKTGIIQYSKFEKTIEHFAMEGDKLAIVAGKEDVTPKSDANRADAGKPHTRRFTEVWVLRDDRWQRLIRHASTF